NSNGVDLNAPGTVVQGNFIGTNASGTGSLANGQYIVGHGVFVLSSNNTIGGSTTGARNVISGNNGHGVVINDAPGAANNTIAGNYIGTNAVGTAALPNTANGVAAVGGSNTIVGGFS